MNNYIHGVNKYGLINAGTYNYAVLPLDHSVSLCAKNNTGKSQLINSLQFLYIDYMRDMSFGKYDAFQSKSFYFKTDHSYIFSEITLPQGTYTIVACGQGISKKYNYEYLVYSGPYQVDYFIDDNQSIRTYKELKEHLKDSGVEFFILSPSELRDAIIGLSEMKGLPLSLPLIPLKNASERRYQVFKKIFKNLLSMGKLSDREVKNMILNVFSDSLANSKIDYMRIYQEAFRDHDLLKQEIRTLHYLKSHANSIEKNLDLMHEFKHELAEKKALLIASTEKLSETLPERLQAWETERAELEQKQSGFNKAVKEKSQLLASVEQKKQGVQAWLNQYHRDEQELALASIEQLSANISALDQKISSLEANLKQTANMSADALARKKEQLVNTINRLQVTLRNQGKDVLSVIANNLSSTDSQRLSAILSKDFLSMACDKHEDYRELIESMAELAKRFDPESEWFLGFDVSTFSSSTLLTVKQIEEDLALAQQEMETINEQLVIKQEAEEQGKKLAVLKSERNNAQFLLNRVQEHKAKRDLVNEKNIELEALQEEALVIEQQQEMISKEFSDRAQQIQQRISDIDQKKKEAAQISNLYSSCKLLVSDEIPSDPYASSSLLEGEALLSELDSFKANEQEYFLIDKDLDNLNQKILNSYSRHAGIECRDEHLRKVLDEIQSLDSKEAMLEKMADAATTTIGMTLKELHDNYYRLEKAMADFNRSMNKKTVSNLKSFHVRLVPNELALKHIKLLLQSLQDKASNEQQDLLNFNSDIKQNEAVEATRYLSNMVKNHNDGLSLEDLFELKFEICYPGKQPESYKTLDSIASNGTVMTIKALFNIYLIRFCMDEDLSSTIRLPFYIDEVAGIDEINQITLVETVQELGFVPVFAAVNPTDTTRYVVDLEVGKTESGISINENDWITLTPLSSDNGQEERKAS